MAGVIAVLRPLLAMLTRRERGHIIALALMALIGAIVEALSIGAVFPLLALLSNPDAVLAHPVGQAVLEWLGDPPVERLVLIGAFGLLVVYITKNLYLVGLYAYQAHFVCGVEARLGISLLSAYLRAPYSQRLLRHSADKIRIVTTEVSRVTIGVMLALIALFSEALVVIAVAALLLVAQPVVAIATFIAVAGVAFLMQTGFQRTLDRVRAARVKNQAAMFRWLNEGLGALKEIKVLGREEHVVNEFGRFSRSYARGTYIFTTLNQMPRIVFETAAIGALMVAVILVVLRGMPLADIVPTLSIFGLAAVRLLPSASRIVASLNTVRYYTPAVDSLTSDLVSGPQLEISPKAFASARHPRFESLRLKDVSYQYPGASQYALRNVNFLLSRGEWVAILGRSGSGKTTLIDLVLGLIQPTTGVVEINGEVVHWPRAEWRGRVGLVPQEIFLVDDTVRRNIAFGVPDDMIDDTRVWNALYMARLDKRIRALPQGLETVVGERGATLSGGERQRLGISRALYHEPEILVLDEPTSAVDAATESEFLRVLEDLRGETTVLMITHRGAAATSCDRLSVIRDGVIVAEGTPADVMGMQPASGNVTCARPNT